MSNQSGLLYKITTFGESHGPAIGLVIDGCPPKMKLDLDRIQADLNRRKPGQSHLTTSRQESDQIEVLSGLFEGYTTGMPLTFIIRQEDQKSHHYDSVKDLFRPGHADKTYYARFGIRDHRGGGRASARETAARVIAASVARQYLSDQYGISVLGWVDRVAHLKAHVEPEQITFDQVESNPVRCPDQDMAKQMETLILEVKKAGDTVGGVVGCIGKNIPEGWGSPVFDKLEADLAKACLSLPACKGFEIGSGFEGTYLRGSAHNDQWVMTNQGAQYQSNHAGGTLGGISTGQSLVIRTAFKPVSTHFLTQSTVNKSGELVEFKNEGRHDPCVLARSVVLVESAMLLTLMDHALRTRSIG
jgi:chorismate synthase